MAWFRLFLPLLFFLPLNGMAAALLRRRFGDTLPPVLCGSAFALYFSQYFLSSFSCAYILLFGLAALSWPGLIYILIKKPDRRRFALTSGTVAFIVIYVFACAMLAGKKFYDWDEFTHWGMMVKESLRLDKFHCVAESRLKWHKDYPPFAVLFETLWCRMTGYSEGSATIAAQVLTLSVLLPGLMERLWACRGDGALDRRNWIVAAVQAAAIEVVFLMFEFSLDNWPQKIIHSILPDVMLSFFFAYLFLLVLEGELDGFALTSVALVGAAMLLTKQVGIAFCLVILLLMLLKAVAGERGARVSKKALAGFCACLAVLVVMYVSWDVYKRRFIDPTDTSYMYGQFNLRLIDFPEYLRALKGQASELRNDTLRRYLSALVSQPINNVPFLPLTYASAYGLCMAVLFIFAWVFKAEFPKRRAIVAGIAYTVGTAGYAFMMSVLYLFCFSDGEKESLAGFTRYMDSYVLGEMLVLLCVLAVRLHRRLGRVWTAKPRLRDALCCAVAALVSLAAFNPQNAQYLTSRRTVEDPYAYYQTYADRLREAVPPDSKVFIVYDNQRTLHTGWWSPMQLFVQYYASDLDIDFNYTSTYAARFSNAERKAAIVREIGTCDYLFVAHTGDNFDAGMREYNGGEAFVENGVYSVDASGGALRLTLIN